MLYTYDSLSKSLCPDLSKNKSFALLFAYPSRTLRDCKVFNKVGNESFLEPLETPGNATGDVAKLLVRSLTVVEAHTASKQLAASRWPKWAFGG